MKLNLTWPASVIRACAEKKKFTDNVNGNCSACVKKPVVFYETHPIGYLLVKRKNYLVQYHRNSNSQKVGNIFLLGTILGGR
jgi:hypothetical protein